MARKRRTPNQTATVRGLIRDGIRGGIPSALLLAEIEERYSEVSRNQIQTMIREEQQYAHNVDTVMRRNKGQFVNLPQVLGCTDPQAKVTASILIRIPSPDPDNIKWFGMEVELEKKGRLSKLLQDAIDKARNYASSKDYEVNNIAASAYNQPDGWRLGYIRCQ